MQESQYIWMSGELVPWHEAKIHVLSHVAHYGSGVFEGIRAYETPTGPAVLGLQAHVRRLFQSAHIVEMPLRWSEEEVAQAIVETISANELCACYIRPLAFRGYAELGVLPTTCPVELAIATMPWSTLHGEEALEQGIDTCVSSWRRMAPDTHPAMAKTSGNYVNSQMVLLEARRNGCAEGIVLDVAGYVCECSGENIFLLQDGVLYTPPVGDSILPGITRGYAIQLAADLGVQVREERIAREALYIADEIFLTGTAAEITPVRSVDGRAVGASAPGPVTRRFQEEFFGILQGRLPDRHGWLTPVHALAQGGGR